MNYSVALKHALKSSALQYAGSCLPLPLSLSVHDSAIVFNQLPDNFLKESWDAIDGYKPWQDRTDKNHTFFKKDTVKEMQSSNSSDALLMNVFCHPDIPKWKGVAKLLDINQLTKKDLNFGYKPGVSKKKGPDDTEIDLSIADDIFIEAKLTEKDFSSKRKSVVEDYTLFKQVFHTADLTQDDKQYFHYQLIRNVLAAVEFDRRFILTIDMRRPDLVDAYLQVVRCIKDIDNRKRCGLIFWQDIAKIVGKDLKNFLNDKYGIN